jgi:Raf kinase inhibitor-like YbhB/YbcL family protein
MQATAINTKLTISSPSFQFEGNIPKDFSCEGANKNPALSIHGIPEETKTLAIIMEDPDAPGRIFDHWIVWNIPPAHTISEHSVPGLQGKNSKGTLGYTGPCPPTGTHRYFFKVYAVDTLLDLPEGADKLQVERALHNHVIGYGELIGLYQKK